MDRRFSTAAVMLGLFVSSGFAYDWSTNPGDGSPGNPYQVSTPEQLNDIGLHSEIWDKCFILVADIDMSSYTGMQYNIIGNISIRFTGTFDGNGFVISHLIINRPGISRVGLFGYIENSQILNLGVENVHIIGSSYVGGLVGYNDSGFINICYATGLVSGTNYVGGLVGYNDYGRLTACYAAGSVNGSLAVGGLVGSNEYGWITVCESTASVTGTVSIGGLAGSNPYGVVAACNATGAVSGESRVGGLLGYHEGLLSRSYSSGSVIGNTSVGGLIGYNDTFAGYGTIDDCFWDIQSSGRTIGVNSKNITTGVTGKSTTAMKTLSTFTDAGWDFAGESENGLHDYWQMEINGYPRLATPAWTLAGQGTSDNPYLVTNTADLGKVWLKPFAYYRLNNNLDLTGISWSSTIIPFFDGFFDGQGFVISNLTINKPGILFVGLFGCVDVDGQIQNLGAENVYIVGGKFTGGLAGRNYGKLRTCYTTGFVCIFEDFSAIGGLVGDNDGDLTDCYTTSSVYGAYWDMSYPGGLVGMNSGTVTKSYAAGFVTGDLHEGGLASHNSGIISNCFWDIETSGQIFSDGGIGKTTAQMQTQNTFTNAGWDFVGSGAEGIWWMPYQDYPKLAGTGTGPITVSRLELVSRERTGRNEFEYVYKLEVTNQHMEDLAGIVITLQPESENLTVIDGQVYIDQIGGLETLLPEDTINLRVDRSAGPAYGLWLIEYTQQAPMAQTAVFGLSADLVEDGKIDVLDLMTMAERWLTANPLADIAPPDQPDGIVNYHDFEVLSSQW